MSSKYGVWRNDSRINQKEYNSMWTANFCTPVSYKLNTTQFKVYVRSNGKGKIVPVQAMKA
jgi:hypothetical protein